MEGQPVPLETAESFYGPRAASRGLILPPDRHAEYAIEVRRIDAASLGIAAPEPMVEPSSSDVAGAPVAVTVNYGRWVIDCPGVDCYGAQIASRDDHRFFCVTCGNNFVAGRFVPVTWPDDPDGIDAALSVRPLPFRNWTGEPVDDLLRDNADPANGLVS